MNCQERTHEELVERLRVTLQDALVGDDTDECDLDLLVAPGCIRHRTAGREARASPEVVEGVG